MIPLVFRQGRRITPWIVVSEPRFVQVDTMGPARTAISCEHPPCALSTYSSSGGNPRILAAFTNGVVSAICSKLGLRPVSLCLSEDQQLPDVSVGGWLAGARVGWRQPGRPRLLAGRAVLMLSSTFPHP
jgi:hypothetical protein